ncbi:MAG: hypothetical protein ACP5QA_06010 [Phycisphaerae bacterium]
MARKRIIAFGLLLTAALASARALPAAAVSAPPVPVELNASAVPAKATWIIYLNIDQAMKNPAAGKLLANFLRRHPQARKGLAGLKAMGLKFPQDFHDVLLVVGLNVGAIGKSIHIHWSMPVAKLVPCSSPPATQ